MSQGVRNNALAAAADLAARSKVISEEVAHKKVAIVTGVYSLKTGSVEWLAAPAKKEPVPAKDSVKSIPMVQTQPVVGATIVESAPFPRSRGLFARLFRRP